MSTTETWQWSCWLEDWLRGSVFCWVSILVKRSNIYSSYSRRFNPRSEPGSPNQPRIGLSPLQPRPSLHLDHFDIPGYQELLTNYSIQYGHLDHSDISGHQGLLTNCYIFVNSKSKVPNLSPKSQIQSRKRKRKGTGTGAFILQAFFQLKCQSSVR